MRKEIIVEREPFIKEFLDTLTSFGSNNEFLPIYFYKGELVTVANFRIKDNKGMVGLYAGFKPESTTLEEGDVFYIKEPAKLKKSLNTFTNSDRIHITVTKSQIISKCDDVVFSGRLYDPMLAESDNSFWKPEKFEQIRDMIQGGVVIKSDLMNKIKQAINLTEGDFAKYVNDQVKSTLLIGDSTSDMVEFPVTYCDKFEDETEFNKHLFLFSGKEDSIYTETSNHKIVLVITKTKHTIKYCFIPKKV